MVLFWLSCRRRPYAKYLSRFGHKRLAQCNFKEHINQHFKHTCLLPIMTRSDKKIRPQLGPISNRYPIVAARSSCMVIIFKWARKRPPRRRRSWVYLIAARCVYKSMGWKSNRQSGEQHTERDRLRSWFICKCQIKGLCTQPDLLCGYYRVRGWFRAAGRYHRAAYARAYQPKSLLERVKPSAVTY
jgi:hypothetical protein